MRRLAARPLAALGLMLVLGGCATLLGTPASRGQSFVVFFQPFSAVLDSGAVGAIEGAADSARSHPAAPVTVAGYASPIGTTAANADLARARAKAVFDQLISDGVPAGRIQHKGLGEVDYTLDPIEARRVEISVGP